MLKTKKSFSIALILLLFVVLLPTIGCDDEEDTGLHEIIDTDTPVVAEQKPGENISDSKVIIDATTKYLDEGKSPTISPQDVYKNVVIGGDQSYFLVSLQKPEDYAKGHVKGAINIPFGELYKEVNITKLPKDKKIVTICYTGHTASQAALLLNQLGYEAYAMKFGMMGWTNNPAPMGTVKFFTKPADYPLDTASVEAPSDKDMPVLNIGKSNPTDIILTATESYLNSGKSPTISPDDVYKAVSSQDKSYFIISLQSPADYAKGHVKGAVNIPFAQITKENNLKKIPRDKKIVLICYTGHTASFATMFLNQLGYDAYAMKFGMMGWSSNPAPMGTVKFFTKPAGYEITH